MFKIVRLDLYDMLFVAFLIVILIAISYSLGFYMFIEASYPRKPGDNALLKTSLMGDTHMHSCFHFWYHMNGKHLGTLNVMIESSDGSRKEWLWSLSGHQGNNWLKAVVPIRRLRGNIRVIFDVLSVVILPVILIILMGQFPHFVKLRLHL